MNVQLSRRTLLKSLTVTAAGAALGFHIPFSRVAYAAEEAQLNTWVFINTDDTIRILLGYAEMGQGIYTSIPVVIVDEMEGDLGKVKVDFAPVGTEFANPLFGMQATGGSTTTRATFQQMRQAGATARDLLEQAAAKRWGVDPSTVHAQNGVLVNSANNQTLRFGEVVGDLQGLTPREGYPLKDAAAWRYIGKPQNRLDIPFKVNGTAGFGIDVKVPGMLYGALMASPVFGGKLGSVDEAPAMAVKGVRQVVKLESSLVVVADSYWQARKGLAALSPVWEPGDFANGSSETISASLRAAMDGQMMDAEADGDVDAALGSAAKVVEVEYEVPYLSHSPMEPMNGTAHVTADSAELWLPTQSAGLTAQILSNVLGMDLAKIQVHSTFLGGGFGRRFYLDFAIPAALTSRAVGAPVKVLWSREEDMRHDYYRPAAVARVKIGLDASNKVVGYDAIAACQSVAASLFGDNGQLDGQSVEALVKLPYAFGSRRVRWAKAVLPVPVGFWRSVGASQNGWFAESAIDEAAHAAGAEPLAFRLSLLEGNPRYARVLQAAADAVGWSTPAAAGRSRGIAMVESFGSICAQAVELSVDNKQIRLHKIAAAIDSGAVVEPKNFEAQAQSAIVYGLTAAMFDEITIANGAAVQGNFDTYQMLKIHQLPELAIVFVPDGVSAMGGGGEIAVPPIAPAVTNAIFAATGDRVRQLPLVKSGYSLVASRA